MKTTVKENIVNGLTHVKVTRKEKDTVAFITNIILKDEAKRSVEILGWKSDKITDQKHSMLKQVSKKMKFSKLFGNN